MHICLFCSANNQIDADFFRLTEELGQWMGRQGHTLVFGGVNMGLMECVAKAARKAGALTVGVIPTIIEKNGRKSDYVDVEILCDNLADRKTLMLDKSDVSIALPGGVGTLDEIFSVVASASIGYHQKPVILYNMKGFWNPLLTVLDEMNRQGMIRPTLRRHLHVVSNLEELEKLLSQI